MLQKRLKRKLEEDEEAFKATSVRRTVKRRYAEETDDISETADDISDAAAEEVAEDTFDDNIEEEHTDDADNTAVYDEEYDEEFDNDDDDEPELKVELAKNIKLPKRSVGFDKYSKKLKLNNEDDYYDDDYYDDDEDDDFDDFDDYYKEIDEEKRQERKVTIAAVITSFIIIGIIVFVGIRFFDVFDNAAAVFNKEKTVPNFVGMTMEEAEPKAEKLGVKLIEGAVVDSVEPENTILTQDVDEGVAVTENMEIMVTVSSGANTYVLPNVVGDDENTAISKITSELNANIIIEYEYDEAHTEGTVIKQSPEGNSNVTESVDVTLTICRDQDNINAVVPNVTGLTESDAKSKITSSGLQVGNISYTTSSTVAKGYVITQTANPGEEILKSSTIDIVVSSGRPAAPAVNNNSGSNSNSGSTNTSNNSSTTNNTGNSGNSGNAANNSNNASDNSTNTNTNSNNTTPQGNDVADDVPALGSME